MFVLIGKTLFLSYLCPVKNMNIILIYWVHEAVMLPVPLSKADTFLFNLQAAEEAKKKVKGTLIDKWQ